MKALGVSFQEGRGAGQVRLQQVDPAELSPGEFAHLVQTAVDEDGARVVVIDSLNGYLNAMPEERFLTIQLHELLTYLGRQGVTTFLVVAQHGLMGSSMQSPVDASYLADSVVLFRFFENAGKVKKAISVMKKRSGPHEESIRELHFDGGGIHLSEPLTQFQGILTGVPLRVAPDGDPPGRSGRRTRPAGNAVRYGPADGRGRSESRDRPDGRDRRAEMPSGDDDELQTRVLVLAPTARDAEVTRSLLARAGLPRWRARASAG